MNILTGIKKQKKKKILILSASGQNKGLQALYIELHGKDWTIKNDLVTKYPDDLSSLINKIKNENSKISIKELSELDLRFSEFIISTAKDMLTSMPLGKKKSDIIILNKLSLWTGAIKFKENESSWTFSIGNPGFIASKTQIPVLSDFIERSVTENHEHYLPILNGDIQISSRIDGPALFVNLGLHSHLTLIGAPGYPVYVDCQCGPATSLIDQVSEKIGLQQGFDRDGNEALNGTPDTSIIEYLQDQFTLDPISFEFKFTKMLNTVKFKRLTNQNLLATITAFAALTIINSYRENYKESDKPKTLWISGGGTNNLALVDYLKNYFSPIEVKNVCELGIEGNNRLPLSLALTVNSWLEGDNIILPPGMTGSIKNIGTWYFP